MPKTVRTISVTLKPEYVEKLEKLGKRLGSMSEAVRKLLEMYDDLERRKESEQAYDDYFADPAAAKRESDLTDELIGLASSVEDESERKATHGTKPKRRAQG